jgi:hypothetical protein
MTQASPSTEVWQARIGRDLAAQLRSDSEVLGLSGRTDIVKAALVLLHRRAAEERMARDIDQFYGDVPPALPVGVVGAEADDDVEGPSGEVTPADAAR